MHRRHRGGHAAGIPAALLLLQPRRQRRIGLFLRLLGGDRLGGLGGVLAVLETVGEVGVLVLLLDLLREANLLVTLADGSA